MKSMLLTCVISGVFAQCVLLHSEQAPVRQPMPFQAKAQRPDSAELLSPADIRLNGFLGDRVLNNEKNRLLQVDEEPLLAGFRQKPGSHPWIGEHVGKWMHAASLAWAYTGDPALRTKLDRVAAELIKAQEPDGYLGTYVPEKRFGLYPGADWDVWSHKYNLMGLLTYYQYTGNLEALEACRKIGDLLINTFGPDKKSILSAGTHVGMAATSVLEPMVLLYRFLPDPRYLAFARYLVRSWDEANGPKILASLREVKQVNKTANGKAYEMLSNLVGLCELARATGDPDLLPPVLNAWDDIVAKRLYLTGSASQGEHFRDDYQLPNETGAQVAETCVTTTWIQFNSQLLRLTGEARFGRELEKTFYNHLAAAQRPDGAQWCYFTALEGAKPYGPGINCCVSSGPRGLALVPQHAYLKFPATANQPDCLAVNLYESSQVTAVLGGQTVTLEQQTGFPRNGEVLLTIRSESPATFGLRLRIPEWGEPLRFEVKEDAQATQKPEGGWMHLPARTWRDGDQIKIALNLRPRLVQGEHGNAGRSALIWGPFVLAYDDHWNPGLPAPGLIGLTDQEPAFRLLSSPDSPLTFSTQVRSARDTQIHEGLVVTFADAGAKGGRYRVWLRSPNQPIPQNSSLFAFAEESRSRPGNLIGGISDGDADTVVVTFDGKKAEQDWFAVTLPQPVEIQRVVFTHGKVFHDGGWFDASAGKPRLQAQLTKGGPWTTIGQLESYPATTATDPQDLKTEQNFTQRLAEPQKVFALRVVGKPACGDNPRQAFSSCAELQAFSD